MESIALSRVLHETPVTLIFRYTNYPAFLFVQDTEILNAIYRSDLSSIKDKKITKRLAHKRTPEKFVDSNTKSAMQRGVRPTMSYEDFQNLIAKLLGNYFFHLLENELQGLTKFSYGDATKLYGKEKLTPQIIYSYLIYSRDAAREKLKHGHIENLREGIEEARNLASATFLIKENELVITINVFDHQVEDAIALYDPNVSPWNAIFFGISGSLLLAQIYYPYLYTNTYRPEYIDSVFMHEFGHRLEDLAGGIAKYEAMMGGDQVKKRRGLRERVRPSKDVRDSAIQLRFIAASLLSEGRSTLLERRNEPYFPWDIKKMESITEALVATARRKSEDTAETYWDSLVPKSDPEYEHHQEYYLGHFMCYIIGLALTHPSQVGVSLNNSQMSISSHQLGAFLNANENAGLAQLTKEQIVATIEELKNTNSYIPFLKKYWSACDTLGITGRARILDETFVNKLKQSVKIKNSSR